MKRATTKRAAIRRALIATALIICSFSPAFASYRYEMRYQDTIRPDGHKRSQAVGDAALAACFSQTGLARNAPASPTFKDCMKDHGYQWVSTKRVQDPPSKQTADSGFIDPDNGMLCHDAGFGAICVPPQGTVHYTNQHGLSCTRTGIMSVCGGL